MKFKIIVLITLVFGIVFGQKITDTTNVASETYDKFEQSLNAVKSDVRKLNKTVSVLDSLLKTNQSFNIERLGRIEKSLTNQSTNFEAKIKSINSAIEQNKDELNNTFKFLSDSLMTSKRKILKIQENLSFSRAFDKARMQLGPNQDFEWKGEVYNTRRSGETPSYILVIEELKTTVEMKTKELDNAILKANDKTATLDEYINQVNAERINQILSLDKSIAKTISDRTLYWIIVILILLLILVSVFFFLKSKVAEQQDSLSTVKDTQGKLEKEQIQLDTKLIQLLEQKLEIAQQQPQPAADVDHSLPIKLAEEIHRMRKRLKTMEESRATKVLNKRLESLEEKINNMGYEIIELLGRSFDDGMELGKTQFIPDENLKDGERIITRVIKPRITFKDKIIQHGDVVISQGD